MLRWVLGVAYEGTHYRGWQRQAGPEVPTLQLTLETALSRVANHPVVVHAGGRTDAGVHALGQVVHFDTDAVRSEDSWCRGTNSYLPSDIKIQWIKLAEEGFHARFSAIARSYRYHVLCTPMPPVLERAFVTWTHQCLDVSAMQAAATYFLGTHDFSSFRGGDCQAHSPIRTLEEIRFEWEKPHLFLHIRANGFLHHMVRNIMGFLWRVGEGKYPPDAAHAILEARDRRAAPPMAPASGLCLMQIHYPPEWGIG